MTVFENEARASGFALVAGVDEAGRGPLAGPIVAAAVALAELIPGLDDSKRLTPTRREELFEALHQGGHAIAVASLPPEDIDEWGLQRANYAVMLSAVMDLDPLPDFVLVDGFAIPGCPLPQKRLIRGDSRSVSIAAASIVAKVTRDRAMLELDHLYPEYGFARHKGYPTPAHLAALRRCGPCQAHRKSFGPVAQQLQKESS
jgi:ribonuclease HII